ncbi:AMPB Aminopeptidase, partial [Smithornis capensis]|nr:AMPB Aminopeptidase [Smithornis capensis]
RLELRCERDGAGAELRLDAHPALSVSRAALLPPPGGPGDAAGQALPVESRPFASYGSALHIGLPQPPRAGQLLTLLIDYEAGEGPGVCWLTPEQTAGKQKPYMYTQGQAVLNRSFFPCFDTPSVKFTYSATVKVPEGFTAVMSATSWEKQKDNTFVFKMSQPIPSYLIALVVGDIVSAEVGPRSRVWAEPCLIEAAKKEYDGVIEEFLAVGEKLFGPYVWGRYDILFMPPSFPFGGMENPCLTFVTPCLLAGDRSLVDVIIHEISHSWFGNLVTNATWGEFWLNEGFTMYAQRRISTEVYGLPYTCLEAATGRALLRQHMDTTGEDHPLNKLRVVIEPGFCLFLGVNPDDTYNETPYEKGYCFVSYLAHLVGDQSKFDAFLQAYVNRFKFQSITADDTLEFFLEYFPELKEKGVDSIPGQCGAILAREPCFADQHPPVSEPLCPRWTLCMFVCFTGDAAAASPGSNGGGLALASWDQALAQAWARLLPSLSAAVPRVQCHCSIPCPVPLLHALSGQGQGDAGGVVLGVGSSWDSTPWSCGLGCNSPLSPQGKQKYTLPLYRAMWGGSEAARALAMETFSATAPQLHVNVQNYVKKILGLGVAE